RQGAGRADRSRAPEGARAALDVVHRGRALARSAADRAAGLRLASDAHGNRPQHAEPAARAADGRTRRAESGRRGAGGGGPGGPGRTAAEGSSPMRKNAGAPVEYRVTSGALETPETKPVVPPAVTLAIVPATSSVAGTVKPNFPGTPVQIQQLGPSGAWKTV